MTKPRVTTKGSATVFQPGPREASEPNDLKALAAALRSGDRDTVRMTLRNPATAETVGDLFYRANGYDAAIDAYTAALEASTTEPVRKALTSKLEQVQRDKAARIDEGSTWKPYVGVVSQSNEGARVDDRNLLDSMVAGLELLVRKFQNGNTGYETMGTVFGPMALGGTRVRLLEAQLFSPDLDKGATSGGIRKFDRADSGNSTTVSCKAAAFRTADGSCYFDDSTMGAAGTLLGTNTSPSDLDLGKLAERPDPYLVSEKMLLAKDSESRPRSTEFSTLATFWAQMLVHDLAQHSPRSVPGTTSPDSSQLTGHPQLAFGKPGPIPSIAPDPLAASSRNPNARINEVTSWWDASEIYGSDEKTVRALRTAPDGSLVPGGKLYLEANGQFAIDSKTGLPKTGFVGNWNAGLNALQTAFAQEHNRICDLLKQTHPDFDDDKLYDTARLINAALIAKIHTVEWTPELLGNQTQTTGMLANGYGLVSAQLQGVKASPNGKFGTNVDQAHVIDDVPRWLANSSLFGAFGARMEQDGVPYSMTEEFGLAYRVLHAAVEDNYSIRQPDGSLRKVDLNELRGAAAQQLMNTPEKAAAAVEMLTSAGTPAQVAHNYPPIFGKMSLPGMGMQDLGALDIESGRHGNLPDYLTLRKRLLMDEGATPTWQSLFGVNADTMKELYKGDLNNIDPLVGMLAETDRAQGSIISETQFRIFTIMASRRILADPFFTDRYDAAHYTEEGLRYIDQRTMKDVLVDTYPALGAAGLHDNAFEVSQRAPE